jgi:hypothetical protein
VLSIVVLTGMIYPDRQVRPMVIRLLMTTENIPDVRPYVYEILMYLVTVHAEVSATARNLLDRTLGTLIGEVVDEALQCFRQIPKFGMGGMLRVSDSCSSSSRGPMFHEYFPRPHLK